MVREVIASFMNLCGKSRTENTLKHHWNNMVLWIETMKNEKKILDTLYRLAIEVTHGIKIKNEKKSPSISKIAF